MTQDKYRQAQELTRSVKSLLKDGRTSAAISTFQKGILLYSEISPRLLKGEQEDFQKNIETSLYQVNFDKKFRKACPSGLKYQRGMEDDLAAELGQIPKKIAAFKSMEKRKRLAKLEIKKKEVLDKGKEFLDSNQVKKAYILFRKAGKEFEKDPDYVLSLGKMLAAAERIEDAIEIYKLVEDQKSEDVNFLNTIATMFRKMLKYDRAAKYYDQALAICPDSEALLYNAARNYIEWRKYGQAYELLKKALEIDPDFTVGKKALRAVEKKIFTTKNKTRVKKKA